MPSLKRTIERISAEERIDKEGIDHINCYIGEWVHGSKYILMNLGVHISMGLVRFSTIPIPLPVCTILRVFWVAANRLYYTLKLDTHKCKVHSLTVLAFSAIPFLGYFAYTIPLKKKSEYLAYLYAQHISYALYDKSLEDKLENAPRFIKNAGYRLLIPTQK